MPIDFEPEAKIDFQPETRIDFEPEGATVAQMADATRAAVGVVGRSIAALDIAQRGANAIDPSQNAGALPQDRNPSQENPSVFDTTRIAEPPLSVLMKPLLPIRKVFSQGEQLSELARLQPE